MPKAKKEEEDDDDREGENGEEVIHPEVPAYQPFEYKAGKPNRVKKVERFFRDEETKLLFEEVKDLEKQNEEADEDKFDKSKIYFASIKFKVPKLEKTEEQMKRIKQVDKLNEKSQQKGGRRGSGNLACAIGLYKSGHDLEKL